MKLTRKLLCLLLALALILPMIPAVARAEEVPGEAQTDRIVVPVPEEETDDVIPETEFITDTLPFRINPVYEGLITEADLDIPELPEIDPEQVFTHAETYLSLEEAAAQVRQQMKNRAESFTIHVKYSNGKAQEAGDAVVAEALEHTGVSTEGDYLMWQFAGWQAAYDRNYNSDEQVFEFTFDFIMVYYTTAAQEKEMDTAVTNLINSLGVKNKSDYEKIKGVYDWICDNVTYDYANLEDTSYMLKHTAYAALINKTAVCQGYAVLFYRLMLELGVDNRVIAGLAASGEAHGWNIVKLGDYYYSVDSTWDAGMEEYSFFLTSTWNFVGHYRFLEYETWEFHEEYPMAAEDYDPNVTAQIDPYIYAGTCSETIYWMLLRDGTLIVFGEGELPNFTNNTTDLDPQWEYWLEHITGVIVDEGITRIGDYTFFDLPALTAAAIAPSVTEIGRSAFNSCSNLTQLILSEGLTTIGRDAFGNCVSIAELVLPESLTTIGEHAFWHLEGLKSLTLPSGLTEIGKGAFSCCYALKEVTFPDTLTATSESMFSSCTALETVHLPANLVTIAFDTFSSCDSLKNLKLPDSLKTIENNAFSRCVSLETIALPRELDTLGSGVFYACTSLKTITFPANATLGTGIVSGCTALETAILPEGMTVLPKNTFKECSSLKAVELPATLTKIEEYAFAGCTALSKLILPTNLRTIEQYAFSNCTSLTEVNFPERTTDLRAGAFSGCTSLKNVTLSQNMSSIAKYLFENCPLETLKLPPNLTTIGQRAFAGAQITELVINDVKQIESYAFSACKKLTRVVLPDTLVNLSGFSYCTSLTDITIPGSVTVITGYAFSGSGLTEVTIPDSVTKLGDGVFDNCTALRRVTLPDSITEIGISTFGGCTALTELELPRELVSIGRTAFENCSALKKITFKADAPSIYRNSFNSVIADAYYPAGNDTWTEDKLADYGGSLTWISYEFLCEEHTYEAVVTAPTCTEQGYTTYTCTICGHSYSGNYTDPVDHVYEDDYCKWCGQGIQSIRWYSGTTSLNGTIDLNIYVLLSKDLVEADDTYVRFIYDGNIVDVPMSKALHSPTDTAPNRYRFSCPIYAKQLADNVTVKFMKGEQQIGKDLNYSVVKYCVNQIAKVTDPQELALYKAMLNYGAAAQLMFEHNVENLANATLSDADKVLPDVDASAYKYSISGKEDGIRAKSATLMLEDVVKVRVYFALTGTKTIDQYTFTIDGKVVTPKQNDKGYYVETSGIAAKDLEKLFEIQVGGITVKYGALSYVNSKANGTNQLEANISKALFVYWQAADSYLG